MISNIKELKARGAPVIAIGSANDRELTEIVDLFVPLPEMEPFVRILTSLVVLQSHCILYRCCIGQGRR